MKPWMEILNFVHSVSIFSKKIWLFSFLIFTYFLLNFMLEARLKSKWITKIATSVVLVCEILDCVQKKSIKKEK